MPEYNKSFELTVEDVDLIEMALHKTKAVLARPELNASLGEAGGEDAEETLRQIADLLGRMHNQKVFYRPKDDVYVGG